MKIPFVCHARTLAVLQDRNRSFMSWAAAITWALLVDFTLFVCAMLTRFNGLVIRFRVRVRGELACWVILDWVESSYACLSSPKTTQPSWLTSPTTNPVIVECLMRLRINRAHKCIKHLIIVHKSSSLPGLEEDKNIFMSEKNLNCKFSAQECFRINLDEEREEVLRKINKQKCFPI